jgi:quinolinate synthase
MAYDNAICPNMKLNTLDRIYASLKLEQHLIEIPEKVAKKARVSLEKMFEVKS